MVTAMCLGLLITFPKQLTYETVAKPLERVLADLSELSGESLRATSAVAGEPIVLRLQNASIEDAKMQLARVLLGKWSTSEGQEVLDLDPERVSAAQRSEEDARILQLMGKLQRAVNKLDESRYTASGLKSWFDTTTPTAVRFQTPHERLGIRLLQLIGAQNIVRLPWRSLTIYSTNPMPGELPFPHGTDTAAEHFSEELSLWNEVWRHTPAGKPRFDPYYNRPLRWRFRCRVVIKVGTRGDRSYTLEVPGAGAMMLTQTLIPFLDQNETSEITETNNTQPELSPRSKLVMQASTSEETRQLILHPESEDPLSFVASDIFLQLARGAGKSMVALLPDDLAYRGGLQKDESVDAYVARLQREELITLSKSKDWYTVTATRPATTRKTRVDRETLAKLLDAIEPDEFGALEKLAAFVGSNPDWMGSGLYADAILRLHGPRIDWQEDDLYLYGCLTKDQRERLRKGTTVSYYDLTKAQRKAIYGTGKAQDYVPNIINPSDRDEVGFPLKFRLRLKEKIEQVAVKRDSGSLLVITPFQFYRHDHPDLSRSAADTWVPETASPARYRKLSFDIESGVVHDGAFLTELCGADTPEMPVAKFPAAFFADIQRAGKEWEKSQKRPKGAG